MEGLTNVCGLVVIIVEREKIQLQKLDKFGWFLILLELEKLIIGGVGKGRLNQIKDPTTLLYLVVGREIIDLDISPPRPTTKKQDFF
jgi:hypothetical protein